MISAVRIANALNLKNSFSSLLLMLTAVATLSGCQTLSITQKSQLFVSNGKADAIETHQFPITESQTMVGMLARVGSQKEDSLSDIARHFGLGFNDIAQANPELDPWALKNNPSVLLPLQFVLPEAKRKGIVLNLANMRMFYYPENQDTVMTYPVGIGRDGWNTPLGTTKIVAKKANPAWTVPDSIHREHELLGDPLPKVIPAGPDNPLGYFAMPLGFTGYLIHGTNKPYGIGMQVSHGCVQLYPEDVEDLFNQVEVGTPVTIVHQPYLAAWDQNMLYMEAHPPLEKWATQNNQLQKKLKTKLEKLADEHGAVIDWHRVEDALKRADGIPTPVLQNAMTLTEIKSEAVQVSRPAQLYGQPIVTELTEADWSVVTERLDSETEAQKLAAMLNHQGPQIPARRIEKDGEYRVVAGPFKNKKETKLIAKRIKSSFDMEVTPVKPKVMRD